METSRPTAAPATVPVCLGDIEDAEDAEDAEHALGQALSRHCALALAADDPALGSADRFAGRWLPDSPEPTHHGLGAVHPVDPRSPAGDALGSGDRLAHVTDGRAVSSQIPENDLGSGR
ncbi:hypothetical protein [Streptomyces sp. NPDC054783]